VRYRPSSTADAEVTSGPDEQTDAPTARGPAWFWILAVSLGCLAVFFLVRPAIGPGAYYRPRPAGTTYDYWFLFLAAFVPYGLSLRRGARLPSARTLLWSTGVLYAALIPAPAVQSQDLYQYLLYGKMAAAGTNPYVIAPVATGDPWLGFTLWDDARTLYGPLWTAASAAVVRLWDGRLLEAFLGIKALAGGLAVGAAAMLAAAMRDRDAGARAVVAFAWNPLVVASVGLGAHADAGVAAAFAGAMLAHRRGRDGAVTLLLGVASLVKAYAGLAVVAWLIVLWQRRGPRATLLHASAAAFAVAAGYAPFWEGARTFTGLAQVARHSSASLTGAVERLIVGTSGSRTGGVAAVRGVAALGMAAAVVWLWRRRERDPWRAALTLLAAYALLSPWHLYWHLVGAVALAAAVGAGPLVRGVQTFSASSLIVAGASTTFGGAFAGPGLALQTALRYGPPLLAAHGTLRRGRPRWRRAPRGR
jgi:hypothetical protein